MRARASPDLATDPVARSGDKFRDPDIGPDPRVKIGVRFEVRSCFGCACRLDDQQRSDRRAFFIPKRAGDEGI